MPVMLVDHTSRDTKSGEFLGSSFVRRAELRLIFPVVRGLVRRRLGIVMSVV